MNKAYFGTDGIRGCVNESVINPTEVVAIAMASGKVLCKKNGTKRVLIAKDTRLSGYMIETALTSGFNAIGLDVFQLGPVPTPALAMLTSSMRADMGVMITASHNQFYDNGIKFFDGQGYKISEQKEKEIEALLHQCDTSRYLVSQGFIGRTKRLNSGSERYLEFVKRTLPSDITLTGTRIVIDCANGAGYKVSPKALWELGAEIIECGTSPDGENINKNCGSTMPQYLRESVLENRADIGIALDGDADRVIFVDEKGSIIDGDKILACFAYYWKKWQLLKGDGIVSTCMANIGLEHYLRSLSLKLYRTQVGDRYVHKHMVKHKLNLGGEPSGHIIFNDISTTGDGLLAAIQILRILKKVNKPLSEIIHKFTPVSQKIFNIKVVDKTILADERIIEKQKKIERMIAHNGRLVIRPSGTEPVIRIMVELDDFLVVESAIQEFITMLESN